MFNETTLAIFGILAAIFNFVGLVPYTRDILRRKTKPDRASWWVWLLLGVVALVAQFSAGARWSLGLTVAGVVAMAAIAVLSIKYGYGTFQKRHAISLIAAMVGVVASLIMQDPIAAILTVIGVDAVGTWLTLRKVWHAPESETLSAWLLATIAAVFGVLAVGTFTFSKAAYPVYAVIAQSLLVAEIMYRRGKVKNK